MERRVNRSVSRERKERKCSVKGSKKEEEKGMHYEAQKGRERRKGKKWLKTRPGVGKGKKCVSKKKKEG